MNTDELRGAEADDAENDHCNLRLLPGPRLLWRHWHYDHASGRGRFRVEEVTDQVARYALEPVTLAKGVCLADLFALVAGSPALIELLRRDFAAELIAEMAEQQRASPAEPLAAQADAGACIEYLEVYQAWYVHSRNGHLASTARAHLHGVGPVLEEDQYEGAHLMYPKGSRIKWSLSFSRPQELAYLPVRIEPQVLVYEDDPDAANYGQPVQVFGRHDLTLLQVLQAVFWELSFHGAGSQRDAALQEVLQLAEEVRQGVAEVVSLDEARTRLCARHAGPASHDGPQDACA